MRDVCVGRQPVFDRERNVVAYELLFRASPHADSAVHEADGLQLTANVLVGSLMDIGIEKISSGRLVYINAPRDFLVSNIASLFPPEAIAIEVLEDVLVDDAVVKACRTLKEQGFTLLLDDFVYSPSWEPLLEIADIIKIDVMVSDDLEAEVTPLRSYPAKLLAEKVETEEEFEQARRLGFDYFQGYFFCRPDIVHGRKIPDSKLAILQALQKVMIAESVQEVEEAIVRDVGLSFRLLKYINSAAFGMRKEIESVRQALSLLGLGNIQRWLSLLSMALLSTDKPQELIRMAMLRGRIAEEIVVMLGQPRSSEYFLLGMFSLLDAFLDQPMEQILEQVCLPQDVHEGLTKPDSRLGRLLHLIEAIESANWKDVDCFCQENRLSSADLMAVYTSALEWVDEYCNLLTEA